MIQYFDLGLLVYVISTFKGAFCKNGWTVREDSAFKEISFENGELVRMENSLAAVENFDGTLGDFGLMQLLFFAGALRRKQHGFQI